MHGGKELLEILRRACFFGNAIQSGAESFGAFAAGDIAIHSAEGGGAATDDQGSGGNRDVEQSPVAAAAFGLEGNLFAALTLGPERIIDHDQSVGRLLEKLFEILAADTKRVVGIGCRRLGGRGMCLVRKPGKRWRLRQWAGNSRRNETRRGIAFQRVAQAFGADEITRLR